MTAELRIISEASELRTSEVVAPNWHDTQVVTRRASEIKPEPIAWLWKYWLARGKFHVLAGVPETCKTTIALSYAAIISSGATWPDGTLAEVGSVVIWTSEDDPADTLVPRLMRMGADLDRIHFIEEAILREVGAIQSFHPIAGPPRKGEGYRGGCPADPRPGGRGHADVPQLSQQCRNSKRDAACHRFRQSIRYRSRGD